MYQWKILYNDDVIARAEKELTYDDPHLISALLDAQNTIWNLTISADNKKGILSEDEAKKCSISIYPIFKCNTCEEYFEKLKKNGACKKCNDSYLCRSDEGTIETGFP